MAKITLTIGGYAHELTCRDGEEAHFARLAAALDAKATDAARAVGGLTEIRALLYAGLLMADENAGLRHAADAAAARSAAPDPAPVETVPDHLLAQAVAALAGRIEALAQTLESEALEAEAPTA
jgi:cell division protein ZapA